MVNLEVLQALEDLEKEKGVPKEVLLDALRDALTSAFKRHHGSAQNVRINIDPSTGKIEVLARKVVADPVQDPRVEISLEEAREINPSLTVGDIVETAVTPRDFGRIAAQTAKQVVVQKIREAERGIIYEEFSSKEGDILTGIVERQEQKNVLIDLGRVEAVLAPQEQMRGEVYEPGARIKVYVVEVKKTSKGPRVLVSRTHPGLLKRLLELEVPEVYEGVVEIKSIAREAGTRSKVAVVSRDENVDPVGACVGPRGMRIQAIVQELKGEKIDIIQWDEDPRRFVGNALSPAKVLAVHVNEETRVATVVVPDYQLSLAIGKEGQNARLAAKVTGWKIDIKSESQMRELGLGNLEDPTAGRSDQAGYDDEMSSVGSEGEFEEYDEYDEYQDLYDEREGGPVGDGHGE